MEQSLIAPQTERRNQALVAVQDAHKKAREFVHAAKAPSTVRAYRSDWRDFETWCSGAGVTSMPAAPETVALYLAARADTLKPATLGRRLAAIAKAHQAAGHDSPASMRHAAVSEVIKGIRRTRGVAQDRKAPLLAAQLIRALAAMRTDLVGTRDRALLLVGFSGAFRRSELVALDASDVEIGEDGLTVTLRRSKTDQEGAGRKVGIPRASSRETCPVRALQAWLTAANITEGPLFRSVNRHGQAGGRLSDKHVAIAVKQATAPVGLDAKSFAGHSLRAGLVTSAAIQGRSDRSIMNQTGHRSVAMVQRYVRDASLFRDNAATGLL
jgi:site-specific recombinase XerD